MPWSPEMLYQQRLGDAGGVGDTLQDKLILTLLAEFIMSVPNRFSLFANGASWWAGCSTSDILFTIIEKAEISHSCVASRSGKRGAMCQEEAALVADRTTVRMHPADVDAASVPQHISIFFVSAVLSSLCSFLFIYRTCPVNYCTPEQTKLELCDVSSLPLVLFYSLSHRNNATSKPPVCLQKSQLFGSWQPFFTQSKQQKPELAVNYKYAITFLRAPCLSSAPRSQMVPGRLSYCELPWLIVKHVHVNQAYPKWQLLSRRYNELPEPLQP